MLALSFSFGFGFGVGESTACSKTNYIIVTDNHAQKLIDSEVYAKYLYCEQNSGQMNSTSASQF